jgi:hypothetical protein
MNCDDIREDLASGRPIGPGAAEHLRTCRGCRNFLAALSASDAMPDRERLARLSARLTGSLKPVRPLPSDGRMITLGVVLFLAVACLATIPTGFSGYHLLSTSQKLIYYAGICILALLFSISLTEQIVPGSKRRLNPAIPITASVLLLVAIVTMLFPGIDTDHFVKRGVPCLILGLIAAAVSSVLAYVFVRRGYSVSPWLTAATTGCFAGLGGFAVLALHCPQHNAAHILVWHLSALVISGLAGALLGSLSSGRMKY